MGNSQCKPRQGGESLKEFLSRKFNKIAKKRKIDDLVTIAIITGTEEAGTDEPQDQVDEIELLDLEDDITSESNPDILSQINKRFEEQRTSSVQKEHIQSNLSTKTTMGKHKKWSLQVSFKMPSPNEELFEKHEENDTIRSLQQQLEEVQNELANLQKGFNSWDQSSVTGLGDDRKYNASFVNFVKDPAEDNVDFEETNGQMSQRNCFQTQGDTSRNCDSQAHQLVNVSNRNKMGGTFDRREEKRIIKTGEIEDKQMTAYKGSMKITEGLRTRSKSKPARTNVTQRNNNYTRTAEVDKDAISIKEKIALLQRRDPTEPKPDKGIVWPKMMLNLSKTDKAYYTEQFMRSELFRQRCLRKYQGGQTWMNGLSPFQIWIVEHEGSEELEAVLHPFPKRQNNAQAKVNCWRRNTPPPPPKSP